MLVKRSPIAGPSRAKITITTTATNTNISTYSTNPCPCSFGDRDMQRTSFFSVLF